MNCNLNFNHAVIRPVNNNAEVVEDFSQLREPLLEDPPQPNGACFQTTTIVPR